MKWRYIILLTVTGVVISVGVVAFLCYPYVKFMRSQIQWAYAHRVGVFVVVNGRMPIDPIELDLWEGGRGRLQMFRFKYYSVDELKKKDVSPIVFTDAPMDEKRTRWMNDQLSRFVCRPESLYMQFLQGEFDALYKAYVGWRLNVSLNWRCDEYEDMLYRLSWNEETPLAVRKRALRDLVIVHAFRFRGGRIGPHDFVLRSLRMEMQNRSSILSAHALYGLVHLYANLDDFAKSEIRGLITSCIRDEKACLELRLTAVYAAGGLGETYFRSDIEKLVDSRGHVLSEASRNVIEAWRFKDVNGI